MLFRLIRSHLHHRADLHRQAALLVATFGLAARTEARTRAVAALDAPEEAERAWKIVYLVERKLRLYRQPDTATRYLENRPGITGWPATGERKPVVSPALASWCPDGSVDCRSVGRTLEGR